MFSRLALLNPQGIIAFQEKNIMVTTVLLMLVIVIPVFIMLAVFAWKYRSGNKARTETPQDNRSSKLVFLFWGAPAIIILIIAVNTWYSTHALDPAKSIVSVNSPITIQVVALEWKWLFIYPAQHIATVNFIQVPVNTPINFVLTADAPMNSMWIPQLGGQMYAMPGMSTKLNLMATAEGDFAGSAAEINGAGFAGMRFVVRSSSAARFNQWVSEVQQSNNPLNDTSYATLAAPSESNPPAYYSSIDGNMYTTIMAKYMTPDFKNENQNMSDMPGMNM